MKYIVMTATTISLIYTILISVIYFSKRKINNIENEVYKKILIVSIINMILELGCFATVQSSEIPDLITTIICKSFVVAIMGWSYYFTMYFYFITHENDKDSKSINNRRLIVFLIFITFAIISLVLPIYYTSENNKVYSYGPSTTMVMLNFPVTIAITVFMILKNRKKLSFKKISPFFLFIICILGAMVARLIDQSLLMINFTMALIDILMYFTIENPDVKMLEQVEIEKDRADKANQAKTDFLSTMSHEIRTPLNAIVGFSESLKEESLTPSQLEEVNDIIDASNTLLETVNGILDISKIEANKIEIINETYSTEKLFRELVKLSKARLGDDKPIEFKYHLAEDTPKYLYGDHVRIKQVILNFLTNAIKYTKRGYIEFDVRNICRGNTCRLIIKVEDSGIGIKKESIDRLFDKFDRLDNENSTIEGTGLGLAITKRLVEMMHGKIIVQSIYGKGSQFTIVIDQKIVNEAIAEEVVEKNEEKETITTDLTTKKVLIVDDNLMNLKVAARLLKSYNMQIEQADSGFKCLDLIGGGNKYDLILLDDMMPKMSGKETFKQLKEDPSFNTPVVILTANAITGMKEEYLQFGFDDYLAKPIEKDELNRVIKKFLDK